MSLIRLTRHSGAPPVGDLAPYEEEVSQTIDGRWPTLYFPARLEQLFEHETQHARSRHLVAVGILWILLGILSAIVLPTKGEGPAPFGMNPAVRLGLVTPIVIAIVFAVWWGVRPFVRELLMMSACIIAPASMILTVMLTPGSDLGVNRGAITIILLFITVVVRLRFWFAAVACVVIVALQVSLLIALGSLLPGSFVLALVTIAATLTANYSLEREYRLNYLQRLHGRIQGAQLSAMVQRLHDLSQSDPLTGLPNRRAMDTLLEDLSSRNERYAIILVDIDAFKAFNDCYG